MIAYNSSSQGSMSETSRFIRPLLEFLFPAANDSTLTTIHGYIRKFAHLFEYGLLAGLVAKFFRVSGIEFLQKYWVLASILFVIVVASADEFNQSLNPTRTGAPQDVFIDVIGGLIGVILLFTIARIARR